MNELRFVLNVYVGDVEFLIIVDGVMIYYEEFFRIKSNVVKNDVFYLLFGMWKILVERCFLWFGGFCLFEFFKV